MAGATGMLDWRDVETGAPEIARLGAARLSAARIAMLGTLRRDGSPRISPVEPYLVNGRLLVGAMTWSAKAADIRRDPRYVLHSTVTSPDRVSSDSQSSRSHNDSDAADLGWPGSLAPVSGGWAAGRVAARGRRRA